MTRLAGTRCRPVCRRSGGVDTGQRPGFLQQTAGGGSPATSSAGCRAARFYSHSLSNDLKVGIGLYGNFGLAMDYGKRWAGRNLVDNTAADGDDAAADRCPTGSASAGRSGADLTANYGIAKLARGARDRHASSIQNDHDWQYGARLGVMFEPSAATRIGIVCGTSKVEYDFDFDRTATRRCHRRAPVRGRSQPRAGCQCTPTAGDDQRLPAAQRPLGADRQSGLAGLEPGTRRRSGNQQRYGDQQPQAARYGTSHSVRATSTTRRPGSTPVLLRQLLVQAQQSGRHTRCRRPTPGVRSGRAILLS